MTPSDRIEGMVPWAGGDTAPHDWDGGPVLVADGRMLALSRPVHRSRWHDDGDCADVVAYTPRALADGERERAGDALVKRLRADLAYSDSFESASLTIRADDLRALLAFATSERQSDTPRPLGKERGVAAQRSRSSDNVRHSPHSRDATIQVSGGQDNTARIAELERERDEATREAITAINELWRVRNRMDRERADAVAAETERAARTAECHSDDRPHMGHDYRWHDGYIDGCRGAAAAIRKGAEHV